MRLTTRGEIVRNLFSVDIGSTWIWTQKEFFLKGEQS